MSTARPIEIAPQRGSRGRGALPAARRTAAVLHLVMVAAIVLAVFAQVYLIGAYVFGAGQSALDAHRTVGFTTHGFEVLVLVLALAAWLPRRDIALSLLLAVIGTAQIALAGSQRWVGGLHPLLALVVLTLAVTLAARAWKRRA
jgi:hypothetical protein